MYFIPWLSQNLFSLKREQKSLIWVQGGGFPSIPLAILFPDCFFTLVDSIKKKITVVDAVMEALELKNDFVLAMTGYQPPFEFM